MREILFRGKRLDNGEWVEGCFVEKKDPLLESDVRNAFILAQARGDSFVTWFPVDPATVGQFTCLLDKNGKRIFEGDVVRFGPHEYVIKYIEKYSRFSGTRNSIVFAGFPIGNSIIIGNIHDNPELLEVTPDE